MGNLVADAFVDSLAIDLMMVGSGSIRLEQLGPVVTFGDLVETFPYDDAVYQVSVTGTQLKHMVHTMLKNSFSGEHCEFYQFSSGTRIVFDKVADSFAEFYVGQAELIPERVYTVGLQKFHFQNMKDFLDVSIEETEVNAAVRTLSTSTRDVIEEYLISHNNLDRQVEGRLVVQ